MTTDTPKFQEQRPLVSGHVPNHKLNFLSNMFGGVWVAILQIVFIPVYIRLLGMESYGLIGLYASLQAWMSVMDLGMTPTLTREMARGLAAGLNGNPPPRQLLRTLEAITALIAGVFWAVLALGSGWLSTRWLRVSQLPTSTVTFSLAIMGGVVAVRWMTGLYRGGLVGLQKHVWMNVWVSIFGTLRAAGVVPVLVGVSQTVRAFFLFQGVVGLAEMLVLRFYLRSNLPPSEKPDHFSWATFHQVKRFAGGMTLLTFLGTVFSQLDKIVLSKMLPLSVFGQYAFANTVASSLHVFILAVGGAYSPRLSHLVAMGDEKSLRKVYHEGARLMSTLVISTGIFLILFPDVLLTLWSGNCTLAESVAPLLIPLVLGTMFSGFMHMPFNLQIAFGWTRLSVGASAICIVLLAPSLLFFVPRFGARGAAVCWAILGAGQVLIMAPLVFRKLLRGDFFQWIFNDIGKQAVIAFALVALFRLMTDWLGLTHSKIMWGLFPFLGATVLATVARVSGFWKYANIFRRTQV
jgi:O-antigen/teichoic acid export membrane protein